MNKDQALIGRKYIKKQKLGNSTYGQYWLVENVETKEVLRMKMIYLIQEEDGITTSNLREISILNSIRHPNIVSPIDTETSDDSLILIFQYDKYERSMSSYLTKVESIPIDLFKSYTFQLFCGIHFLHSKRIIHRKIQPSNIILNKKGFLMINNFSSARYYTIPITPFTPSDIDVSYRSPECLLSTERYGLPSDIWSVGCVIAQMATPKRKPLFNGDSPVDQIQHIFEILGTPNDSFMDECNISDNFANMNIIDHPKKKLADYLDEPFSKDKNLIDLLEKIFVYEPDKRISAVEAIDHPFFNGINPIIRDLCFVKMETEI